MLKDWIEVELGDACEIHLGQSPPSSTYNTEKEGLPFFQGKAEFTDLYPVVEKWCNNPKKIAEVDDILLSVRAPVGATNIANQKCAIGRGLAAIRYEPCYKYVLYYLKLIERILDDQGTGTTFKAISGSVLRSQKLPLAPLPEQRAIAAKIEQLFSELDNGIANLKTAKSKLEIYRQAILKQAFEGNLTKDWRKKQPKNHGNHVNQKNHSTDNLPETWQWVKLGDMALKITDGEHITPKRTETGYLLLSARNIQNGFLSLKNVDYIPEEEYKRITKRCNPQVGDILISCSGSIGRVCRVPPKLEFSMVRSVALVKLDWENNSSKFFEYLFLSPLLQSQIHKSKKATAQANLFLAPIKNLLVILCSLEEQNQIVQEIETRLSVCDKLNEAIEQSLEKAQALRQSILKKAFEGKLLSEDELQTCRQQPDWEPATKLLERVKNKKNR
jgi:type I restriction enzyme S subunit